MRVVCAYCRKIVRDDPGSRVDQVSHGMCAACEDHFGKIWEGMSISEYLDTLSEPVLVVDGENRVVAANHKLSAALGNDAVAAGAGTGQAFACCRSRLPEGCGKTVHCRECTIRRAVEQVHETGEPLLCTPAWVKTDRGRVDVRISVTASQGLVKVVVDDVQPARPQAGATTA